MKYVMLETADGQKLPIIFPESLNHIDVADVVGRLVDRSLKLTGKRRTLPCSAGFVGLQNVTVTGESDSLGGMKSTPLDAARIMAGNAVAFMPDTMLAPVASKLQAKSNELRTAAELVEQWWLADGMRHFDGAPAAIFALRAALKEKR
jgi:hypothetical protein